MVAPPPVLARRRRAASTDWAVYMPAAMSAVGMPVLTGSSGVPVIEIRPASAWMSMSYALRSAIGPPLP